MCQGKTLDLRLGQLVQHGTPELPVDEVLGFGPDGFPLGRTTRYTYDGLNRVVRTNYPDGSHTSTIYDAAGRVTGETDANGNTTTYEYDAAGRRTSRTDQNGRTTQYEYDALGRLTRVTDTLDGVTTYTYDEAGNKLTQTDAEGRTTKWTYDSQGRVLSRTLPVGQTESFTYDAAGNRLSHTDFNGQTTSYGYDLNQRLTQVTYGDGTTERYTYDAVGNRLTATTPEGTTRYSYDAQNRLVEEIQPDGSVLSYGYDAAGNRTQLDVSAGGSTTSTSYSFDALNRLEVVADSQGQTLYTYDAVGNRESVSYPSGNVTLYDYDALNRLTRLTTTDAADQILADYAYTLDPTGRRSQVQEAHNGRTTSYSYDELYRLTKETVTDPVNGNYSAEYQFDKVGNRTYSIINGVHTAYSVDNNDRLTQQGGVSYSYDANGNTLTETEDGQVTRYHYDARNKLIEVEKGGTTTGYGYNVDGIRTQKTENGITTHYVVDSNRDYAQVLAEVTNGTTEVSYTYGDDLVSQTRAGTPSYYLYDGHGSTRALADHTGSLTDSYDYDAFGVLLNSSGDTENAYRYTGEQLDPSLDQYYLRARYYDQSSGRFTQQDTWLGNSQDPITLHKYLYGNADPVNGVDPSGNMTLTMSMGNISIMGALSSIGYHSAGVSLVSSLMVLTGDAVQTDAQVTPLDITIAKVKARTCVINGNDKCKLGVPTVFFGANMWDASNHYWEAQTTRGLPSVLNYKRGGFDRSWYTRLSVPECIGRGPSQQCDEYPFNSTEQGGPANYRAQRVSLKLVNAVHNGAAGTLLNSMYTSCGIRSGGGPESAFAAIPVPSGESGFVCPGR